MRQLLANWVAADYYRRVRVGCRVYGIISLFATAFALFFFGASCVLLYYGHTMPMWFIIAWFVSIVVSFYATWTMRPRKLNVKKNPMPVQAQTIVDGTTSLLPATLNHVAVCDYKDVVDWCEALIRSKLNTALGFNVFVPRNTTTVLFMQNPEFARNYEVLYRYAPPTLRGYYVPQVDIAVVGISDKSTSPGLKYVCLNQMLHRYTHSESECTYLTAILSYMSDDAQVFMYARRDLVRDRLALTMWPSYPPKAGWLE